MKRLWCRAKRVKVAAQRSRLSRLSDETKANELRKQSNDVYNIPWLDVCFEIMRSSHCVCVDWRDGRWPTSSRTLARTTHPVTTTKSCTSLPCCVCVFDLQFNAAWNSAFDRQCRCRPRQADGELAADRRRLSGENRRHSGYARSQVPWDLPRLSPAIPQISRT